MAKVVDKGLMKGLMLSDGTAKEHTHPSSSRHTVVAVVVASWPALHKHSDTGSDVPMAIPHSS